MDVYDKSFFDYFNKKFAECFTLRKKLFPHLYLEIALFHDYLFDG